jgi:hypothetical protein
MAINVADKGLLRNSGIMRRFTGIRLTSGVGEVWQGALVRAAREDEAKAAARTGRDKLNPCQ